MRTSAKTHKYQCSLRMPKKLQEILDKNCGNEVMGETQETSVFTGDCEGNRTKLPKKRGSVMAPPSTKH